MAALLVSTSERRVYGPLYQASPALAAIGCSGSRPKDRRAPYFRSPPGTRNQRGPLAARSGKSLMTRSNPVGAAPADRAARALAQPAWQVLTPDRQQPMAGPAPAAFCADAHLSADPHRRGRAFADTCVSAPLRPYTSTSSRAFGLASAPFLFTLSFSTRPCPLHCDLRADLDRASARDAEILARVVGRAGEPDEQLVLPARHRRLRRRPQARGATGRTRSASRRSSCPCARHAGKRARHVRRLHEAEAQRHARESVREPLDR